MWVHGSTTEEKETSPNVKMKMNEEEGPGEYDHTEELVKAWKVAVLGNLQMQHSRQKQKTRLPKFRVNIKRYSKYDHIQNYDTNALVW